MKRAFLFFCIGFSLTIITITCQSLVMGLLITTVALSGADLLE